MLRRDYLVKQFEEFGKVLAAIIGLKRDGNTSELDEMIRNASQKFTSLEISTVETISNDRLLDTLSSEKQLSDEQLKILADLLFEKAEYYLRANHPENQSKNCYKKAHLIYLFLRGQAILSYSLDMHYKLEILSKMDL